ncbi:MAG TPA: GNAT family N-acetyltransferase [Myxococcota bacterium]|nr:GNAT family N-acetyltransferase [Myxococcota bacterium]
MGDVELSVETSPDPSDVEALGEGLTQHALPTTGRPGFRPLAVFARDAAGTLVGGAYGQVNWNWLSVSLLWVAPDRRGDGLGSRLLSAIEEAAYERGCSHAHLDTFSYQARPFYERHGYTSFATLEEYPPGQQRHFLRKALAPRAARGTRVAARAGANADGRARTAPEVEIWFEFASTYSYPAVARAEDAARAAGVALSWHAFLLGPIFKSQGWNDSPFNLYPVKGRYMWRDLERTCEQLGLPFRRPSSFPRNGLLAARVACAHAAEPWLPAFVRGAYRANFAEDRDIASPAVLGAVLEAAGAPAAAALAAAETPQAKERLRAQSERAVSRGIFGAPSFVARGELFWGNDRLDDAFAWARRDGSDTDRAE